MYTTSSSNGKTQPPRTDLGSSRPPRDLPPVQQAPNISGGLTAEINKWLANASKAATVFIKQNPGTSLVLSAALGGVAGWLIKRNR